MVAVLLLVGLGLATGAALRMAADRLTQRHYAGRLGLHLGGCATLGFIIGLPSAVPWLQPLSVGSCGIFVGYAATGLDTVRLLRQASLWAPVLVLVRLGSGFGVGLVGLALAGVLTGQ